MQDGEAMKITVGQARTRLFPETEAEVHQLEWVRRELKILGKKFIEDRQWDIQSLALPLSEEYES